MKLLEETPPEITRTALPAPRAILDVQNLAVVAPGATVPVVRGASFPLEPGRTAGIAEASASGKSTLAQARSGVWNPAAGLTRLDGAELDQYGQALGRHVGYLPQVVVLFEGSVAMNVARMSAEARDDVLVRLDGAHLRLEETILQAQYAELTARRNRLEAECTGSDVIAWDPAHATLAETNIDIRDVLAGQERLFQARRAVREGEVARIREQIGQARAEIAGLESQTTSLGKQRVLLGDELNVQRSLFDQGLALLSQILAPRASGREPRGAIRSDSGDDRACSRPHSGT